MGVGLAMNGCVESGFPNLKLEVRLLDVLAVFSVVQLL